MEYLGSSSKLQKILGDEKKLVKSFGKDRAIKILQRLAEISVAENLSQVSHFKPTRLHRLKGERQNEFAVDVGANWRMIFEGYDEDDELSIDEEKIVTVLILDIEDYH